MEGINNQERALIYEELMEVLETWNWEEDFDLSQLEGEAILYLLQSWDSRRRYLRKRYEANREEYIDKAKRRYKKNHEALRKKRLKKLYDSV